MAKYYQMASSLVIFDCKHVKHLFMARKSEAKYSWKLFGVKMGFLRNTKKTTPSVVGFKKKKEKKCEKKCEKNVCH